MIVAGIIAGAVVFIPRTENAQESSVTIEEWHREYAVPFHKQMATWQQLSEDLGMVPGTPVQESNVPYATVN
ncbi:hypothetical protein Clow_01028 [Corynebacterium lowii]|uniref:Uncharacterized protein n=2 Tax=Corynebacterium lowii TaxID=1544413 RepID=A0A0Q0YWR6_9CORY|nr:hypothetical protein Clow_01028 [Corynebacterium lowii]